MFKKYQLNELDVKMKRGEPQMINCDSPYVPGSVTAASLERGSHFLGLAKKTDGRAIYTGHGRITVSEMQFEHMGRPDRICVDWDGEKLSITPYYVKMLVDNGNEIKTGRQLEEMDMQIVSLLSDGFPTTGYSDRLGENFFRKLPYDGEHDLFMRVSRDSLGFRKPEHE
jgi:hypothetical protein